MPAEMHTIATALQQALRPGHTNATRLIRLARPGALCLLVASILLTLASTALHAAEPSSNARLNVARLLALYDGQPVSPALPDWPASVGPRLAREQAGLYIAAVIDAGESQRWCVAARNLPPHERDAQLLDRLRAKNFAQQGNAAQALAKVLSADFPCGKARGATPE